MTPVASSVRAAIVQSYMDRHEPPPSWIAQPVIWHLGLLRRLQLDHAVQFAQERISRARFKHRRR